MKNIFRLVKGLLPLLGLLLSLSLSAQDIVVKGHVKDATGESVIGANILIKGTSIGTISDVDGNFTLKAATGNVLTVTCIGYKGQEITVIDKPLIVVTMQEDSELLDEVVVIGYGQVKKGDVTGSLLTVKPDELNKGKQLTAEDALVGKVAGLCMTVPVVFRCSRIIIRKNWRNTESDVRYSIPSNRHYLRCRITVTTEKL